MAFRHQWRINPVITSSFVDSVFVIIAPTLEGIEMKRNVTSPEESPIRGPSSFFRQWVCHKKEDYENHDLWTKTDKGVSHSCYGGVANLIQFAART
jgi:hypothetical protein